MKASRQGPELDHGAGSDVRAEVDRGAALGGAELEVVGGEAGRDDVVGGAHGHARPAGEGGELDLVTDAEPVRGRIDDVVGIGRRLQRHRVVGDVRHVGRDGLEQATGLARGGVVRRLRVGALDEAELDVARDLLEHLRDLPVHLVGHRVGAWDVEPAVVAGRGHLRVADLDRFLVDLRDVVRGGPDALFRGRCVGALEGHVLRRCAQVVVLPLEVLGRGFPAARQATDGRQERGVLGRDREELARRSSGRSKVSPCPVMPAMIYVTSSLRARSASWAFFKLIDVRQSPSASACRTCSLLDGVPRAPPSIEPDGPVAAANRPGWPVLNVSTVGSRSLDLALVGQRQLPELRGGCGQLELALGDAGSGEGPQDVCVPKGDLPLGIGLGCGVLAGRLDGLLLLGLGRGPESIALFFCGPGTGLGVLRRASRVGEDLLAGVPEGLLSRRGRSGRCGGRGACRGRRARWRRGGRSLLTGLPRCRAWAGHRARGRIAVSHASAYLCAYSSGLCSPASSGWGCADGGPSVPLVGSSLDTGSMPFQRSISCGVAGMRSQRASCGTSSARSFTRASTCSDSVLDSGSRQSDSASDRAAQPA